MNLILKVSLILLTVIIAGCSSTGGVKQLGNNEKRTTKISPDTLKDMKSTREKAFANTFQRSQLDVGTPGKGRTALAILKTQAELLKSVNNGSRSAKQRLDILSSAFETVKRSNRTSFNDALLKNTPLAERRALAILKTQAELLNPTHSGLIHVRGYYRNDGTYVPPHTRRRSR